MDDELFNELIESIREVGSIMQDEKAILAEFEKLTVELYQDGYTCDSGTDDWIKAWARAMLEVAKGAKYTSELLIQCHSKQTNND